MSPRHPHSTTRRRRQALIVATALACAEPILARADDSIAYKFQSWREDHDRIAVDSHYGLIDATLCSSTQLKLMGVIDSIAGATPTGELPAPGQATPTTKIDDRREAWDARLDHTFPQLTLGLGASSSRESDYVSRGWSLHAARDFDQKNTTLSLGYGRTDDRIKPTFFKNALKKNADDFQLGLTQLINASTSLNAGFTYGRSDGYHSDPYKLVSKTILYDIGIIGFPPIPIATTPPENRPNNRTKRIGFLSLNRHFEKLDAATELSYRLYRDSFGITSHTVSLEWFQKLGSQLVLRPSLRYYTQSAADFYYYDLNKAKITTFVDPYSIAGAGYTGSGRSPYYSSDNRLSKMRTLTYGLKLIWEIRPWLSIDIAAERYLSTGRDKLTPQDAYADARILTLGLKLSR